MNTDPLEDATAAIPSCTLDDRGRREQRARYEQLASTITRLDATPEAIVIEFAEQFHRETLARTIAVEQECCPFFVFEIDELRRRVRITVDDVQQVPALEAMAAGLSAVQRVSVRG